MTATSPALLDTDMLSEVMRARDPHVLDMARHYLAEHGRFTFSIITRYEILRGLKAREATRQVALFERQCARSVVLPLTDQIIVQATDIYAGLYKHGELVSDADILIAATAVVHDFTLITGNVGHFQRIPGLQVLSWRSA
jgi:tRNA(fMet)-specific endonuclease VapC